MAVKTLAVPDEVRFTVGKGGFQGNLWLTKPTAELVTSLPDLANLQRPAYVVHGLLVHPLRRGKGWARILVETAQHYARAVDHDLYLWVEPYTASTGSKPTVTKRQLQAFYRRLGFSLIARTDDSWYHWPSQS